VLNVPTYTLSGLGGQPLSTNLTSLSALTYASTSFVKMTAAGTFALDTNTYLTSVGTGTTNQLTYWSGTNTLGSLSTTTYPSLTELSYVKGVTSSIQTQITNKQNLVTLTTTGTTGAATFNQGTGALNIPQYSGGSGGGAFIPLSGTAALANVTGDIEVYDTFKLYDSTPFTGGEKSFEFTSNYVEISNSSSSGLTPTKIQISDNEIVVFCGSESAGVSGDADYSANYGSLSYIQRIYADSERIDGKTPNYTLGVTDLGRTIETTAASANTLTINDTILSTLPVGGKINIIQYGAGQTQVVTTGAAVLLSSGGADKITNQYGAATIIKRSPSEFYLFGEITI
jgi:hypothetical protein